MVVRRNLLRGMVGACGFEPQTPTVAKQRSTLINLNNIGHFSNINSPPHQLPDQFKWGNGGVSVGLTPGGWDCSRVIGRPTPIVTYSHPHAIAGESAHGKANQHVSDVSHAVVQSNDHATEPIESRDLSDLLDGQRINTVRRILSIDCYYREVFARQDVQFHNEEHYSRALINSPLNC